MQIAHEDLNDVEDPTKEIAAKAMFGYKNIL